MPEAHEGDEKEPFPIPLKSVVPVVSKKESKLQELIEDLRFRGCEGLLSKSWNLWSKDTLRESKSKRGKHWLRTIMQAPDLWTLEVWARVYWVLRGKGGWAGLRDCFHVGKFQMDTKDGFYPGNCRNRRKQRVLEFFLPVLIS